MNERHYPTGIATLVNKAMGQAATELTMGNIGDYMRGGSDIAALAEDQAEAVMPDEERTPTSYAYAQAALQAIVQELERREDHGSPYGSDYDSSLEYAFEMCEFYELLFAMGELLGGNWEFVVENRRRVEDGREMEKERVYVVRGENRLELDEVQDLICDHIMREIEHWILRIGTHLSHTVARERWAEAFDIAPDDEYMLEAMDGWLGSVLRGWVTLNFE